MKLFRLLSFFLVIALLPVQKTFAEPRFSDCLLPRASQSTVSLGAPLAPERLGNKSVVRYGVLPFHFKDLNGSNLTDDEKRDYLSAAKLIETLSGNRVKFEFVFYPTVMSSLDDGQASRMLAERDIGWATWDLSKSTFGIVKETVKRADLEIDFSNLDGVILINKSVGLTRGTYGVAEAFQFFRKPPNLSSIKRGIESGYNFTFHESISTQEGIIDNAVLLDRTYSVLVIAHEILHNFGLTDLYGNSTPPSLRVLSIMTATSSRLLNYEKAVLGWMPLNQITCYDLVEFLNRPIGNATFTIDDIGKDQIVILKISNQESYLLEVVEYLNSRLMIFYRLKMEERPPIEMLSILASNNSWEQNTTTFSNNDIGKTFFASDFQLLFSDKIGQSVTFQVVSNSVYRSETYSKLLAQIEENRSKALAIERAKQEADARTDAELRAKRESEVKAAEDKAAAEIKARQEAEAAAAKSGKRTITCVKGTLTRTVVAVKPKCPKGFRKK